MENNNPQPPEQNTPPVNQETAAPVSQQPQPEARKTDNRLLKVLIITIAVFLVISFFGSWAYYRAWEHQRGIVKKPESSLTPSVTPTTKLESTISAGQRTYRNEEYGFEFKYPTDFYVKTRIAKISDFPEAPQLGLSLSTVLGEQDTVSRSDVDDDCSVIDVPMPQGIKSYCKIKQFGQVKGKLEKYYVGEDPSFGIKFVFYKNEARISLSTYQGLPELYQLDYETRILKFNEYFDSIIARDSSNPGLAYHDTFDQILSTFKFWGVSQ